MKPPPLETRHLGKVFGVAPVLRDVSFRLNRGEGGIIVGGNGSGKSTLVRILAGLSAASSGEALVFGQPAYGLQAQDRQRIGLITHQTFLYPRLTAHENLEFYAHLYRYTTRTNVTELLERVGLGTVANERVSTFSRGMEQRLAVARATLASPDVLLMDEPFTALDREGIEIATDLISEALERGGAIVITAHERLRLGRLAFSGYALVNGRLAPASAGSNAVPSAKRPAAAG